MVAMPAAVGGLPNKRPVQGSMYYYHSHRFGQGTMCDNGRNRLLASCDTLCQLLSNHWVRSWCFFRFRQV